LKTANAIPAGKSIKCPKCGVIFKITVSKVPSESPASARRETVKAGSKPPVAVKPTKPSKPAPTPEPEEDEEEAPPPKPKKSAAKGEGKGRSKLPLILAAVAGVLLLAGGTVGGLYFAGILGTSSPATKPGGPLGATDPGTQQQPLAGPAYTIQLRDVAAGEETHISLTSTSVVTTKVTDTGGKVIVDDKDESGDIFVYTQTTSERPNKDSPPTRARRQYEKAEETKKGQVKRFGFHDKPVLIEKKGDKWEFRYEGGAELPLEDSIVVYRDFDDTSPAKKDPVQEMLPKNPVKVGETWSLNAEAVAKLLPITSICTLDAAKATGTGKLLRVYKQGERQCGVMEFTLTFPVTRVFADMVNEGSRISVKITVDGCIDGTSPAVSVTDEGNLTYHLSSTEGAKDTTTMIAQGTRQFVRKDVVKK